MWVMKNRADAKGEFCGVEVGYYTPAGEWNWVTAYTFDRSKTSAEDIQGYCDRVMARASATVSYLNGGNPPPDIDAFSTTKGENS